MITNEGLRRQEPIYTMTNGHLKDTKVTLLLNFGSGLSAPWGEKMSVA